MPIHSHIELQKSLRIKMLRMYHAANAGHVGCSLSCIDLLIACKILYAGKTDEFVLSKGHAAVAMYVVLNYLGEISDEELLTFYHNGTHIPAHPPANAFKGISFALGSLGHGMPIAAGMAKAAQITGSNAFSLVLLSDGETNEGTTWEAAHFAVTNRLENLIVLIDKNGLQGFGETKDILGDTASPALWNQIGFDCLEVEGHNLEALGDALATLRIRKNGKPKLIVAKTIKGKGVSYMENRMEWHYKPMTEALFSQALKDLDTYYYA